MNKHSSLSAFRFFYRCLFSKKANSVIRRVSFICFFGLTISIGSLLIVFNVMGGLGHSIKEQFLKTEPHIIVSLKEPSTAQAQKEKIQRILTDKGLSDGVVLLNFFESVDIVIRTGKGAFSGAVAKGYDSLKNFLRKTDEDLVIKMPVTTVRVGDKKLFFVGETNKKQKKNTSKPIIMGFELASQLNIYEKETVNLIPAENLLLPPGEPVPFELARVGAVTQNSAWSAAYVFYNRRHFPSFRKTSSYGSGFEISLKNPDYFLPYQTALQQAGFLVETWPERNSSVFFALKAEKIIMSLFLSLAGLITLLAVCSLLALLIVQKKKEIGILMAMGLSARKIRSLFVKIGLILCSMGILGAVLFSLSVCWFLKYQPVPFLSQFHAGAKFPVDFNFPFMIGLTISVFVLSFVSCILSVRSQFRYFPAELLKTVNA